MHANDGRWGHALQGPNRELADERSARAVLLAQATGRPALESAALDQRTALQLARGDIAAAHASCLRRIELLGAHPHGIPVAGEVNDATQMATLTSLATGDLARGHRFARMRPEMSFYSEESGNPVATAIVARADALLQTDPAGLADAMGARPMALA